MKTPNPAAGASPVGQPVPRKEGPAKVDGSARYVDDLFPEGPLEGTIHGVTVRSPVPRGRIRGIHFEGDLPWDEIVVVTAKDILGKNVVTLMVEDQPYLADDVINHAEEPVVLLAHADRYLLERARKAVRIEVEPLPSVETIEDSLAQDVIVWGDDNVQKRLSMVKGDVDAAFAGAVAHVVEGVYETSAQEQLYIEPQGMIAIWDEADGVTVWGSLQCPYYVQKALMPLFGLGRDKVRVVQATTGGGFGGKEEYPSLIAGHAALLARKAGRPVKIIYDRAEDMQATTKRHPSRTRVRTAHDGDGRLLAIDVDFVLDGGAYVTLSPVVLSRGVIHAAGPYNCAHTRVMGRCVATNLPPHGAFRGFGAPQSIFAFERHLDRAARVVGISSVEMRKRNLLKRGQTTSTGHTIDEDIDLNALLDRALGMAGWDEKRAAFAKHNAEPGQTVKKGVGLATFYHGSGFTGSGEVYLASVVHAQALPGGRVEVLAASTEIGQGSSTIFAQVAAAALGVPYEWIQIAQPDTAKVPDSGPTVASRTTMVVGKLVEEAAASIAERLNEADLLDATYSPEQFAAACDRYLDTHGELRTEAKYEPPPGVVWDDQTYQGAAYACYGWAAYIATVSVDTVTWEARLDDFVALQDIGKVVHPMLAAGQIEGGVAQGIGYALYEDVIWQDGRMINNQMTNYIMPTTADLPPIRVAFHEVPYSYGPGGGAKGLGELPMDGPAPAIVNALQDAVGLDICRIPARPEALLRAAEAAHV